LKKLTFYIGAFFCGLILLNHQRSNSIPSFRDFEHEDNSFEGRETEEHKFDQPDKFLQYHAGIRTREGEAGPSYGPGYKWRELENAKLQSARKRASGRTQSNGVIEFKERGPANVPGRTRALLNVPGDPANNTWLAGSATGGIWRTTDGGLTWQERSADFPALPISSFASTTSGSVIYAATGEYVSSFFSAIGNGVYKSTDKGITWTSLTSTANNPDVGIITRIIVDPNNANTILVTTAPHNLSLDRSAAILRSTDGGTSWTKVKYLADGAFEQIIATPGNFNIQYASQNDVGVWKSTDAGATWALSNNGMQVSGRLEIAVSPVNPNKIFGSAEGRLSGTTADLYYSDNGGSSWSLIDVKFNNAAIDFLQGQGFYDNTILCDPFDQSKVYFGGVSLFRATVTGVSSTINLYRTIAENTESFLLLQSFANILHDNQRLTLGTAHNDMTVEVRFGPGRSQSAHRFVVPEGATSGVLAPDYSYQNYVTIPCEVWDVTNNRQLMVSFRDQNRNGKFDLIAAGFPEGAPLAHSREYFYVHNVAYNTSANSSIATNGGQEFELAYNFFPALAAGAIWDETTLPTSKLTIKKDAISKISATTVTAADGRNTFDKKNASNQQSLSSGVHPDHHFMIALIDDPSAQTFRVVLGNDGGVFVSRNTAEPGIVEGDWSFRGFGYNTSQFYGADKAPGLDQYIGGMQDNGTRYSQTGEIASSKTNYTYAIGGDGFETIWHSKDPSLVMGSVYNGNLNRSTNGAVSWSAATTGLPATASEFSFVTKIANSKDYPDRVFIPGMQGVYRSTNFGAQWNLTPISTGFVSTTPTYLDVEVSRANPNIVWAGSGMTNTGTIRKLFVSTNGGTSFSATNNYTAVTLGNLSKLASHPTEPNTAYAIFSISNAPKILRTTDLGNTWQDITGLEGGAPSTNGFPNVAVYCVYVRPDNPNIIWAGTEIGIVESQDNGVSWSLLNDFPKVTVWDMKGQDDQVVIATHGRGIWTATIGASQNALKSAEVMASGTSPGDKLVVRIAAQESYDSIHVILDGTLSKRIYNVPAGSVDHELSNDAPGAREIKLISYKGSRPTQSFTHRTTTVDVLDKVNSYSTYFTTTSDITFTNLIHQNFTGSAKQRKGLHTHHPYQNDRKYELLLRRPVVVSDGLSTFSYSDIAVVDVSDAVKVEATKNGLDWVELDKHDATLFTEWQTLLSGGNATSTMFKTHGFDLKNKFAAGDVLLFRISLQTNASVNAWGWALDWIAIQEDPVGNEPTYSVTDLSTYPNPSKDNFNVEYNLKKHSEVSMRVTDVFGRTVLSKTLGLRGPGVHTETFSLIDRNAGTYVVVLLTGEGKKVTKVSLVR
jgi:photosystem II stability/assembly factor-like uncharacterized protein